MCSQGCFGGKQRPEEADAAAPTASPITKQQLGVAVAADAWHIEAVAAPSTTASAAVATASVGAAEVEGDTMLARAALEVRDVCCCV